MWPRKAVYAYLAYRLIQIAIPDTSDDSDKEIDGDILCLDDCAYANDGVCDDGGEAGEQFCDYGSDCTDCGPRESSSRGNGTDGMLCSDTCIYNNDTACDDGGDGGEQYCEYGTDCADCGPRESEGTDPEPMDISDPMPLIPDDSTTTEMSQTDLFTVRKRLFAEGTWLEIEVQGYEDESSDEILNVTFTAPLASASLPPTLGYTRPDGDGIVATVATIIDGIEGVEQPDLLSWFREAGVYPLLNSETVAQLLAAQFDTDVLTAIAQGMDPDDSAEDDSDPLGLNQQALSLAGQCGLFSSFKMAIGSVKTYGSCGKCSAKLAAAAAGTAGTVGLATVAFLGWAARDCIKCAKKTDKLSKRAAECWYCCWGPNAVPPNKTDAICQSQLACPNGRVAQATESKRFCECVCDPHECNDYCDQQVSSSGGSHTCDDNNGRCNCDWDAEAYCQAFHSDRYCTGASKNNRGGYYCPQARCNDGKWDSGCENSALDEACDRTNSYDPQGTCDVETEQCGSRCSCEPREPDPPEPMDCREECYDALDGFFDLACYEVCCCRGGDVCGLAGDGICDCNGESYWDVCDCDVSDDCEDTDFSDSEPAASGNETGSFSIEITFVNPRYGNRGLVVSGELESRPVGGATSGGGASGSWKDSPDDYNGLQIQ